METNFNIINQYKLELGDLLITQNIPLIVVSASDIQNILENKQ